MPNHASLRWLLILILMLLALVACQDNTEDETPAPDVQPTTAPVVVDTQPDTSTDDPDSAADVPSTRPTLPAAIDVDTSRPDNTSVDVAEATAGFRLVQTVADLPSVDVLLNDEVIYRGVAPLNPTLPVLRPSGEYTLVLSETTSGRPITGNEDVYFSGNVLLEDDITLTFLFSGDVDSLEVQVLEEDLTPLEPNQARLSIVNLVEDADPLSVQEDRQDVIDPIAFDEQSPTIIVRPRTYLLDFLAGTTLVRTDDVTFQNGFNYVLVLTGTAENAELLTIASETPPQTRFRVVHAAPDTISLQVQLNDEIVAERLDFGDATEFMLKPSAQYSVDIFLISPDGTVDESPVQTKVVQLRDFEVAELVVYGADVNLEVDAFTIDSSLIQPSQSRVMFVHLAFGVPQVSVQNLVGNDLGIGVNYGNAQTLTFRPNPIDFFLYAGNSTESLEILRDFALQPATVYTYFIVGRMSEEPFILAVDGIEQGDSSEETVSTTVNSTTQVQVYNAWDDTIEVNFNGDRIVFGLPPGRLSDPVPFVPTSILVEVLNTDGNLLFEKTYFWEPNDVNHYRLYIVPNAPGIEMAFVPDANDPVEAGFGRVQFVHALPALDELAVTWGETSFEQMFFGGLVSPALLEPGSVTFNVADRSISANIITETIAVQTGDNYRFVILESAETGEPEVLVLPE